MLIARALAGNPDLLVLDEPTPGSILRISRRLPMSWRARLSAAPPFSWCLHDVGVLAPLIDRALVLCDGRVST